MRSLAIGIVFALIPAALSAQEDRRLVAGVTVTEAFAEGDSASHSWSFRVRRPGLVTLRVESAEFTPTVSFWRQGRDGWTEEGMPAHQDSGFAQVQRFPAPGVRYQVRIGRAGGAAGRYTLHAIEGAPTRPVQPGESVSGSLDGLAASTRESPLYHFYRYEDWAVAGDLSGDVVIRAHSPDFEPRLMIGTRDGDAFRQLAIARAGSTGDEARLEFRAESGVRYVVRVGGHNADGLAGIGSYTLELAGPSLRAGRGALGRIQPVMDLENWVLQPAASGPMTVSLDSLPARAVLEVAEQVGDDHRVMARQEGLAHSRTELRFEAVAGRSYLVRVRGSGSSRYTLRVAAAER